MSRRKIFQTAIGEISDTDKDGVGTIRFEGGKTYRYVHYFKGSGAVTATGGDVLAHGGSGSSGTDMDVTADFSDGNGIPAGVVPPEVTETLTSDEDFTGGKYFWLLIEGRVIINETIEASNDTSPVSPAVGDPIVLGDADKTFRRQNTTIDVDAERVIEAGVILNLGLPQVAISCRLF